MSDTNKNVPGISFNPAMMENYQSHSTLSHMTPTKYKNMINGIMNKSGWFESATITNDASDDSICLISTNANSRAHDRTGVEMMGEVPKSGSRVLMYRKSGLDWPCGCGQSSILATND